MENGINKSNQYISFKLGAELFGIDILEIKEIIKNIEVTKLPDADEFIKGIINLRGEIIPIIDLRNKFNMPVSKRKRGAKFIIVNIKGNQTVGLMVDDVEEVVQVENESLREYNQGHKNDKANFIEYIGQLKEKLLIILDLDELFTFKESFALDQTMNKL